MLRARQKIGKYRILGRIASGPLAHVYSAYDSIQKIRVALKIPRIDDTFSQEEVLHEVRVAILEPDDLLRPEMGARVIFSPNGETEPDQTEPNLVLIPSNCVVRIEARPGVFEVDNNKG